ncbi:MAG: tetratricopeptide repeat protein [Sulfurovum sp.]|nr:tetratricopeptide repeat protein [Sulfurovum sp.]NNJ45519.1 tetratricopeptide repeat protein [Sulfurovum sp.]
MNILKQIMLLVFVHLTLLGQLKAEEGPKTDMLERPLMERYILDELKSVRMDNQQTRVDMEKHIAQLKIEDNDRAARYMTDTIANIFYLIAAATSILFFAGWNSLRDIRSKTEEIIETSVEMITEQYKQELTTLQDKLQEQSQIVLDNQNNIYKAQLIHSYWMRSNLETNAQAKIDLYDEILNINDNDAEVYAYKADAVLDLDEYEWALNLSNKAIEIDNEYGYAYWQRSCAQAKLDNFKEAVKDLEKAIEQSPSLKEEIENEPYFTTLRTSNEFKNSTVL